MTDFVLFRIIMTDFFLVETYKDKDYNLGFLGRFPIFSVYVYTR